MTDDGPLISYVPPLPIGTRAVATDASELAALGTIGTITWHHPWPEMPYRVKWEGIDLADGAVFGMSDIGWLTRPDELRPLAGDDGSDR